MSTRPNSFEIIIAGWSFLISGMMRSDSTIPMGYFDFCPMYRPHTKEIDSTLDLDDRIGWCLYLGVVYIALMKEPWRTAK